MNLAENSDRAALTQSAVERVRQAVIGKLERLAGRAPDLVHETILIRNGLFCGRRFQWEGYQVIWFLEEDQVKFIGPCGNILNTTAVAPLVQSHDQHNSLQSYQLDHRNAA
ncbi:MAG: hypothetical protein KF752_09975 [Pirellulaceae bacterium]|nr:hypothetical protein [Pirellulaceae bacterium]